MTGVYEGKGRFSMESKQMALKLCGNSRILVMALLNTRMIRLQGSSIPLRKLSNQSADLERLLIFFSTCPYRKRMSSDHLVTAQEHSLVQHMRYLTFLTCFRQSQDRVNGAIKFKTFCVEYQGDNPFVNTRASTKLSD